MQFKHQYKDGEATKDDWETPSYIFKPLNRVFKFDIDVASSDNNYLCNDYYTPLDDGLEMPWSGNVFCNPPYSNGQYGEWIDRAVQQYIENREVYEYALLLPASWETKAFEPVWDYAHYLIFPYTRIKFELDGESIGGAPFSSLIAIFTYRTLYSFEVDTLSKVGRVVDLQRGYRWLID